MSLEILGVLGTGRHSLSPTTLTCKILIVSTILVGDLNEKSC